MLTANVRPNRWQAPCAGKRLAARTVSDVFLTEKSPPLEFVNVALQELREKQHFGSRQGAGALPGQEIMNSPRLAQDNSSSRTDKNPLFRFPRDARIFSTSALMAYFLHDRQPDLALRRIFSTSPIVLIARY